MRLYQKIAEWNETSNHISCVNGHKLNFFGRYYALWTFEHTTGKHTHIRILNSHFYCFSFALFIHAVGVARKAAVIVMTLFYTAQNRSLVSFTFRHMETNQKHIFHAVDTFFSLLFCSLFFWRLVRIAKIHVKSSQTFANNIVCTIACSYVCGESCANVKRLIIGIAPLGKLLSFSQFPR